jgi:hypothetical protein
MIGATSLGIARARNRGTMGSASSSRKATSSRHSSSSIAELAGKPSIAACVPTVAERRRRSFFSSSVGLRTNAPCSPSRRLSSSIAIVVSLSEEEMAPFHEYR